MIGEAFRVAERNRKRRHVGDIPGPAGYDDVWLFPERRHYGFGADLRDDVAGRVDVAVRQRFFGLKCPDTAFVERSVNHGLVQLAADYRHFLGKPALDKHLGQCFKQDVDLAVRPGAAGRTYDDRRAGVLLRFDQHMKVPHDHLTRAEKRAAPKIEGTGIRAPRIHGDQINADFDSPLERGDWKPVAQHAVGKDAKLAVWCTWSHWGLFSHQSG